RQQSSEIQCNKSIMPKRTLNSAIDVLAVSSKQTENAFLSHSGIRSYDFALLRYRSVSPTGSLPIPFLLFFTLLLFDTTQRRYPVTVERVPTVQSLTTRLFLSGSIVHLALRTLAVDVLLDTSILILFVSMNASSAASGASYLFLFHDIEECIA